MVGLSILEFPRFPNINLICNLGRQHASLHEPAMDRFCPVCQAILIGSLATVVRRLHSSDGSIDHPLLRFLSVPQDDRPHPCVRECMGLRSELF